MSTGNLAEKKPLIFVTGKGGVGKSVWALAIARKLSKSGKKTLLVEFGDSSFFSHFLGLKVGFKQSSIEENLDIALWDGSTCLKEYITHIVKVKALTNLFFDNRVMSALIKGAPALKELAILGKATSGPRNHGPKMPYDHIVFDGFATGHFLALLRAPKGIYEAIKLGPMGDQSLAISKTLEDPNYSEFNIVTLVEDLPVSESIELKNSLFNEFGIRSQLVCNRIISSEGMEGDVPINEFTSTLQHQLEIQKHSMNRLNAEFKDPIHVPFYFELDPLKLTDKIGEALR